MLLFGRERVFHYPDAWVQCGRFIGNDKGDIFDHIELEESLPESVESIMLFLKKHAMRGADFSEIQRKDVWSIPIDILREVVINALVHSDYSQRGAPVRVAFFDDRIEVENPGILMPGMTIEDMKSGVSKIRNPVIARVFRELKLIEQWGSGVRNILRAVAKLRLPEPLVQEIGMRVRFTVYLAKPHTLEKQKIGSRTKVEPDSIDPQNSRLGSRLGSRLESRLESTLAAKVFVFLAECEEGKAGLAEKLGHKTVSGELHKQIRRLLELELIEMTIPDKPSSRLQKYRLTNAGRALIASSGS